MALSVIERAILPERPAFFVTAGKRGGGKTTAVNMISLAATGRKAAATPWSPSKEERRKALLAALSEGLPILAWDNVETGSTVSSPSLEAVLTSDTYTDRVLGETRRLTVPTHTIMTLNGNNIAPRGDMSSRSLMARINVDRPDPENRQFAHPLPFDWTLENRGKILRALYTVLLGNKKRLAGLPLSEKTTRFKPWWMAVGSAVECASEMLGSRLKFSEIFSDVEDAAEDTADNVKVLEYLEEFSLFHNSVDGWFKAADIAEDLNGERSSTLAEVKVYFAPNAKPGAAINSIEAGLRLKLLVDAPFIVDDKKLTLVSDRKKKVNYYKIKRESLAAT